MDGANQTFPFIERKDGRG